MKRLEGKIALVTGAARGIGAGVARCLAAEGAHIAINDVGNLEAAEATADEIRKLGAEALILTGDVSDRQAVSDMVDATVAHFGRLDIAVANAAISRRGPFLDLAWEDVQRTLEVAQFGVFHTCQLAARQMVRQPAPEVGARGKIIFIGSVHQELPVPGSAAYNMAKVAINHLARTVAAELAGQRINVNVINPGWIDTPGERVYSTEEQIQAGGARIPWGRIGTPDDIGKAAVFLASNDADYITGTSLRVDGGYVLNRP
ncbi:MAG: short-chain dehydrogenase [Anaerolineaceae bacterium]|nr:short-chain dehydrogenase [Anaerolineaceae bacterium]